MNQPLLFPKWEVNPSADDLIYSLLNKGLSLCQEAENFRIQLLNTCAVRLRDILDHMVVPESMVSRSEFLAHGWIVDETDGNVLRNTAGLFPAILSGQHFAIAFKVEHVRDFVKTHRLSVTVEGKAYAPFQRAKVWQNDMVSFWVVQRNGSLAFEAHDPSDEQLRLSRIHLQTFRSRRRQFNNPGEGFDYTDKIVQKAVADLDQHWACDLFLRAEREFWMTRNYAGRVQKSRQDQMGIGWANQDHHTYDSSRTWFHRNIKVLENLGFVCRERFYAGADAGWGSQILEQPVIGSIIFTDIDLSPEELEGDFAHNSIPELPYMRRAGLWTALHGESMLDAGLNHLECMFDQKKFREQFHQLGIQMMNPFSNFPHLYQELTVGEWWPVDPAKVDVLEKQGLITQEQAEDFRLNGAIGSHFENLERNQGYKGFNQPGIDGVLRIIDPRKNLVEA